MVGFASTARSTKAFGLAASLVLAAYAGTSGAAARDLLPPSVKKSLPPACLKLHGTVAQLDCGSAYYRQREEAAKARGAEADKQYDSAHQAGLCTDFLIAGVKGGTFTKSAVLTFAKGKLTAENACEVARGFGYSQKAELERPAVR